MKKTRNGALTMTDGESFHQWLAKERDDGRITAQEWKRQLREHGVRFIEVKL